MSTAAEQTSYRFDDRAVAWRPFPGFGGLWCFVLDVDGGRGQVDMLMRFAPHVKCVPHRHVGPTRTLVIDGEHRMYAPGASDGAPESRRPAGTFSRNDGDETHVEGGSPDGAVILLSMTAVDGAVCEILNEDLGVDRIISLDDFRRGLEKQRLERDAAAA